MTDAPLSEETLRHIREFRLMDDAFMQVCFEADTDCLHRLHISMVDAVALEAGEDFENLPDAYVIFIMERDPFGKGLPLYHFVRAEQSSGLQLNDGSHIVCVNGEIRGTQTKLARLMLKTPSTTWKCRRPGSPTWRNGCATTRA